MAANPKNTVPTLSGDPVIQEARERADRGLEWEANSRTKFIDDLKFAHGDSDNGYQWPNAIRTSREVSNRPCLTMNVIRQHNLQIQNEMKKNKSSIAVRATAAGASKASADVYEALIRRIEYQSNAQDAYSTAAEFQVTAGIGWWRLYTQYESNDSFDQDIYIGRVWDPLSVLMDPDCQQRDCSDSNWALVFDSVPVDEFEDAYPKYKDQENLQPLGIGSMGQAWTEKDHVLVCEYFRRVLKPDELVSFVDLNSNERKILRKSHMPESVYQAVIDLPYTKRRPINDDEIEWKLIVGERIIDKTVWPGKYIPLIRVIGEETVIEGILDRKGHTRALKDAQRMYNYNASAQVEFVALQSKTPWIAAVKAIEEYESYWNTANTANHSVLPYNHVDDDNPSVTIPPPTRQEPPSASPGYQTGMETAFNQMMMTSGQWQNQMGMMGNERTGAAIDKRQQQSDTSVFHFQDNYAAALRTTGKYIIDVIPHIYDTKRVFKLLHEDGEELEVENDPAAQQALQIQYDSYGQIAKRIFNPAIGKYDIEASVGPAYGTRRQATVDALTLLLTQAPALTGLIGDLLLSSMDFPKAQDAAQRLKRMVPAQALGKGPTQQEQQLTQQVQALTQALAKALETTGKDKLKLVGKEEKRDIEAYDSETKRMTALQKQLPLDPEGIKQLVSRLVDEAMNTPLKPVIDANKDALDRQSPEVEPAPAPQHPIPGARQAPDGEWYLADPTRHGKYLKITPLATKHKQEGMA